MDDVESAKKCCDVVLVAQTRRAGCDLTRKGVLAQRNIAAAAKSRHDHSSVKVTCVAVVGVAIHADIVEAIAMHAVAAIALAIHAVAGSVVALAPHTGVRAGAIHAGVKRDRTAEVLYIQPAIRWIRSTDADSATGCNGHVVETVVFAEMNAAACGPVNEGSRIGTVVDRSEEHTSELQSLRHL